MFSRKNNRKDLPGMESVPDALSQIAFRFARALESHGAIPGGVGWSSQDAQARRFQVLLGILHDHPTDSAYSAFDLGCGYGALWPILRALPFPPIAAYHGYDISDSMIAAAQKQHGADPRALFSKGALPKTVADYGFVSGTFNYRGTADLDHWQRYVGATILQLLKRSRRGLAINFLREGAPSTAQEKDAWRKPKGMFRTHPEPWIALIKKAAPEARVQVIEDYLPDDFTVLIRLYSSITSDR